MNKKTLETRFSLCLNGGNGLRIRVQVMDRTSQRDQRIFKEIVFTKRLDLLRVNQSVISKVHLL